MKNKIAPRLLSPESLSKLLIILMLIWFILGFLIVPNLNVILSTFHRNGTFSLDPVRKLLGSERAMKSLKNSFILALSLPITVNVIGILLVLISEYFLIKGARILRLGYMTTLLYSGVSLVSGYIFVYGKSGVLTQFLIKIFPNMNIQWFEGYPAVLFVMTFAATSGHLIFLTNAIKKVDYQTIEAAKNLGASTMTTLFKVVLPTVMPTIFAMTILTFLSGLIAFAAPLMVGGQNFQTITPMVLSFSRSPTSKDLAALLAICLGLATMFLLFLFTQLEKRGYYMSISKVKTAIQKQKIENPLINLVMHIIAYLLFIIYMLPFTFVILFSFMDGRSIALRTFNLSSFSLVNYIELFNSKKAYAPIIVSLTFSTIAAIIVMFFILLCARIVTKYKNKLSQLLEYMLLIPWLLPATLIAMGLILTFNEGRWWVAGQKLTGTIAIMILAYVIIKIPFTMRMTKASFYAIDNSLEEAAQNLGAKPFYTFFKIIYPIVLPSILAILALNINSLLVDYDLSVFLYHPLLEPLGVVIRSLTDSSNSVKDNTALVLVYAVVVMFISGITFYTVYGDKTLIKKWIKKRIKSSSK